MASKEWLPEEDAVLRDRIASGEQFTIEEYKQLGKQLNRRANAVFGRVQDLVKQAALKEWENGRPSCEDDGSCIPRFVREDLE